MSAGNLDGVAVIGLAGRFPMSRDPGEFWHNLCAGRDCLETLDEARLREEGVPDTALQNPAYVRRAGTLEGYDEFDAEFFGFSSRFAALMDPQQRLFLQACWHAMEDAGYDTARCPGAVGVFGAGSFGTYYPYHVLSQYDLRELIGSGTSAEFLQGLTLNDPNFFATRVAHALDLHGPALTVQTACSSTLLAVHLACQSLLSGESDMALAGGMTVRVPHRAGYVADAETTISPDGYCRPFDANGNGTVFTSGGGVVVLKRLADALDDGDDVRAVVLGSAANNDGSLKMGYAAPSVDMQAEVIAEALAVADVEPATVGYVEAHGTGTALGDPVEVAALRRAFGESGGRCAIGSVKGNIGHCEVSAGIAGLIKTVLSLEHRTLVPTAHFTEPNPELRLDETAFHIQDRLADWEAQGPRRAGVSSLGVGGTNVHVVLEEAPAAPQDPMPGARDQVLVVSARSPEELTEARRSLAEHLRKRPEAELTDVAFTLAEGRREFPYRFAIVASTPEEAADAFTTRLPARESGEAVLLFPGSASQAEALYRAEPAFADHFDRCADLLGVDPRAALQGESAPGGDEALRFGVEYAMARALETYGVRPAAVAGLGTGEYAAACFAGVVDLAEALRMVIGEEPIGEVDRAAARVALRPGEELARMVADEAHILVELRPGEDEPRDFRATLARLWSAGHEIDWGPSRAGASARRVRLPGYPFQRTRHWLDSAYVTDQPPAPAGGEVPAAEHAEDALTTLWSRVLGVARIGADDNFFELGGDSVLAAQVAARARAQGLRLTPRDIHDNPTLSQLAAAVEPTSDRPVVVSPREKPAPGPSEWVPLTPFQLQLMSAEGEAMLFGVDAEVEHGLLLEALTHVREHHDALRMDFVRRGLVWEQHAIDSSARRELPVMSLEALARSPFAEEDRRPSLLAAVLDDSPEDKRRLAVLVHPAVADRIARQVIAEDLATACRQLLAGRPADLPPVRTSWTEWAGYVAALVSDDEVRAERTFWSDTLARADGLVCGPSATAGNGHRQPGDVRRESLVADRGLMAAIRAFARSEHRGVGSIVLGALAHAATTVTGRDAALLDVTASMRKAEPDGMDLSRTVGHCASIFPVAVPAGEDLPATLRCLHEALGAVPRQGLGYGVLRHLHGPTAEAMRSLPAADTVFTDCGAISMGPDAMPGPLAPEPSSAPVGGPPLALGHALDVRCYRQGGRLHLDWWYDGARLAGGLVAELRERTLRALAELVPSTGEARREHGRPTTDA